MYLTNIKFLLILLNFVTEGAELEVIESTPWNLLRVEVLMVRKTNINEDKLK